MDKSVKKLAPEASPECGNCLAIDLKLNACTGCFAVQYCGRPCQLQHWKASHKLSCKSRNAATTGPVRVSPPSRLFPDCPICLEQFTPPGCTRLLCGHIYHTACCEGLFAGAVPDGAGEPSVRCPQCQKSVRVAKAKKLASSELLYAVTFNAVRSGVCTWASLGEIELAHMAKAHMLWERGAVHRADPVCQYYLGLTNFEGHGVPVNNPEGLRWMHLAAEQGVACARSDLGRRYFHGLGVDEDLCKSYHWTFEAAKQGDVYSQIQMAALEQRLEEAGCQTLGSLKWMLRAALQGSPKAQLFIAKCYFYGHGIDLSLPDALRWFLLAATQGDYDAQIYAGVMYFLGEGTVHNYSEAFRWFVEASQQGPHGQYLLAAAYGTGRGTALCFDAAVSYLQKSANYGHPGACYQLAIMYAHGYGVPEDRDKASGWLVAAHELGYWTVDILCPGTAPSTGLAANPRPMRFEGDADIRTIVVPLLTEGVVSNWARWFRNARPHKKFSDCNIGSPLVNPWRGYMLSGGIATGGNIPLPPPSAAQLGFK